MKLPTWDWHEARKQFELRVPGLVNTRRELIGKLEEAGREWQKGTRKA